MYVGIIKKFQQNQKKKNNYIFSPIRFFILVQTSVKLKVEEYGLLPHLQVDEDQVESAKVIVAYELSCYICEGGCIIDRTKVVLECIGNRMACTIAYRRIYW
jgi:hypothetical protein